MIAVSFCNTKKNSGVYILNNDFTLLKEISNTSDATGLVKFEGGFFVATKGYNIAKVNSNLEIENIFRTGLSDIHSMRIVDDTLFVIGTGTDTIAKISIRNGNLAEGSLEVFWASGSGQDSLHINSLEVYEEILLISGFGDKTKRDWKISNNGFIRTERETLISGLRHPHSLKIHDNNLYFLESKTSTLFKNLKPLFTLKGYLRGLDFLGDDLIVGSSKSRNDLVISNNFATLSKVNDRGGVLDIIEFEDYEEIYDILVF